MSKPTAVIRTPVEKPRYAVVDLARGIAVALMFVYHFCYDLTYFGLAGFDFYHDPFWLNLRTLIVSLFLGLVGVSLHLATRAGLDRRAYLRRLALIGACAAAVSLATYLLFGNRWVFFGILHFIAVASVLALPFTHLHYTNLVLGAALIALPLMFSHALFDQPGLRWLGLMTHKPRTEDYVPLLPWLGVVLIGLFLGQRLFPRDAGGLPTRWPAGALPLRALRWAGRHSLALYMLHQPAFMGLLFAATWAYARLA